MRTGADLEALEFAWRRSDRRNPLSKRLAIVLYLAEATPDGYAAFVNESEARLGAWLSLAGHFVRGLLERAKGRALLRRLRATA